MKVWELKDKLKNVPDNYDVVVECVQRDDTYIKSAEVSETRWDHAFALFIPE